MSYFTWHDNHNLDYGGIAHCDIEWNIRQLSDLNAIYRATPPMANDNALVWHRARSRDDAEAMAIFRFLDHTVAMETDR